MAPFRAYYNDIPGDNPKNVDDHSTRDQGHEHDNNLNEEIDVHEDKNLSIICQEYLEMYVVVNNFACRIAKEVIFMIKIGYLSSPILRH